MSEIQFSEVFEYIKKISFLRLDFEIWYKDQKFIEKGGRIYYAVDTDTVMLFTDPANKLDYVEIFPQESEISKEILAWALGKYIFFNFLEKEPLLIIPPYDLEIERVIISIARRAKTEKIRLPKILEVCQKAKSNLEAFLKCLEDPLDLIWAEFGGKKSAIGELYRITQLLQRDRLLHIERYRENDNCFFPFLDESTPEDYKQLKQLALEWKKRLKMTKSFKIPEVNIDTDAKVLAQLEWINQQIQGDKKRLVLISGDKSMWEAASKYLWEEETFAELFIRHPKIYMGVPEFLLFEDNNQKPSKYEKGLIQWIDVFLAKYGLKTEDYPNNLKKIVNLSNEKEQEKIARRFLEKDPQILSKLKKEWEEFVKLVGASYIPKNVIKEIGKMLTEDIETIKKKINEKRNEVLKSFWSTIIIAGYSSLEIPKDLPIRGIPALRFTLEPVRTHVEKLCRSLDTEKLLKELSKNTETSFKKLDEADKSGYTAFLLFALAFAALGRWRAAIALSDYALYIADNEASKYKLPDNYEPITGNEAAYLLAWAYRHNVSSPEELEKSKYFIEEAKRRKKKACKKEYDIRFEAELVIVDIIYRFFEIFLGKTIEKGNNILTIQQCYKRILSLLDNIDIEQEEEYIKILLKKQLYAYLFYLFLIRKEKLDEDLSSEEEKIKKFLKEFNEILGKKGLRTKTCFTYPICLCMNIYFSKDNKELANFEKKFNEFWRKYKKKCILMPYDEEMYSFLKNIIEKKYTKIKN